MKDCSSCKNSLDESCFGLKKKNGKTYLQSLCKECNKKANKIHYQNNKQTYIQKAKEYTEKIIETVNKIKEENPCKDCGKQYRYYVMDFDHIGEKEFGISEGIRSSRFSLNKILKEIEKCELVCANCHRERTHNRMASSTTFG